MQEYWTIKGRFGGYQEYWNFELRSNIALGLIEKWGMVSCSTQDEDSSKRFKLTLHTPQEIVDRAFAIADCFVLAAEARNGIKIDSPQEQDISAKKAG